VTTIAHQMKPQKKDSSVKMESRVLSSETGGPRDAPEDSVDKGNSRRPTLYCAGSIGVQGSVSTDRPGGGLWDEGQNPLPGQGIQKREGGAHGKTAT